MSTASAEKLVAIIARAFYTDTFVVLLDALVREKYIREDEIAPRLKLPDKDVKRVLFQLKEEMIIRDEDVTMDDGQNSKCWYIDYQLFVHVVRYRVHLIQSELNSREKLELNHIFFECPTCKEKYGELDVLKLRSKDSKFICGHCCPYDNIRETVSEPYFRLVEHDRGGRLTEVQLLRKKMDEQLHRADGLHGGIYDLLSELRDQSIIRNLPSDNIKRGIKSSKITDEEVLVRIEETKAAQSALPGANKRKIQAIEKDDVEDDLPINYSADLSAANASSSDFNSDAYRANVQKSLPEFLQGGSRVKAVVAQGIATSVPALPSTQSEQTTVEVKSGEANGDDDDEDWED